jgi:IS30 family transposase
MLHGKKHKQLSLEERTVIQTQLSTEFKLVWIVRGLGRSASTTAITQRIRPPA